MINNITQKFTKLHLNIYIIAITLFINTLMYFSWYPVLPIYLRSLGAGDIVIGYAFGVLAFGFTLFQFFGGLFADRFSLRKIIILMTFLAVPAYILAGLSKNWTWFLFFLLCSEVFTAIQWPAFMVMVSECASAEDLGFAYSIFEFSILLGFTAGPAMGWLFINKISVPQLIVFGGIICAFTGIARWIFMTDVKIEKHAARGLEIMKTFFNVKFFLALMIFVSLGLVGMITIYGPFIAMYCKDIFIFNESKIQFLIFIGNLFGCVISFLAGYLADRYGSKIILAAGLFFQAVFFMLWARSGANSSMYLYFIFAMVFLQAANIAKNKFMMEAAPPGAKGLFVGLLFTSAGILSSTAPIMGSYAMKSHGAAAPFYLNFLFGTLAIIFILLYSLKSRKQKRIADSV